MTMAKVDTMPAKRCSKKCLMDIFNEFISMNVKLAKVEFEENEYKSVKVADSVLRVAAKRYGVPIKVRMRNDEIYFERRDI